MKLQSAVRVILGYFNNKNYMDVKEVDILYIIPILPLTNYHDYSPPFWEVMANIISSYFWFIKSTEVFNCVADPYLLLDKPIFSCITCLS